MHLPGLFLGLAVIDIQYLLPEYPAPNSKHRTPEALIALGGPATNAAATFAYLGGDPTLFSVIGQHSMQGFMEEELQAAGIRGIDMASERTELPVFASVWTSRANGDRTIVSNARTATELDLSVLEGPGFENAKVILVDGFYSEAARILAQGAQAAGIPVVMDGGSWKPGTEALLALVDIAICSADFRVPGGESVMDYCRQQGVLRGAITRGKQAIQYWDGETQGEIPVPQVTVVDTLGAGDVFHGAFCWYYAETGDFVDSLQQAAIIAAESCRYLGARGWMET